MTIEKLASLLKKGRKNQLEKAAPLKMLEKVVFIDSTWPQSYGIRTVRVTCTKVLYFIIFPLKLSTAICVI